jgi:branched-chain amino acid transport system substrate-binding protein
MRALLRRWPLLLVAALAVSMMLMAACEEEEEEGGEVTPGAEVTAEADGEVTPAVEVEVQGVTDTEIKVGTILPLTGTAAAWGVSLNEGMQAYYDYINDNGGIYGRKITLIVGDSAYEGPMAKEAATKLVEQDKVFLIQGSLGTAAHMAIYKYLEENNIIDYAILSGNSTWTDPVAPTRFVGLVDYVTEGRVFGKYIAENYEGAKVGILAQNDDYGKEGEEGTKQGLEENDADVEVVTEYYEAVQSDMTSQAQRLRNEGVDVIVVWSAPVQAGSLIKAARETLNWDVDFILSSTLALDVVAVLAGFDNIEGSLTGAFGRLSWETDVPFIAWLKDEVLAKYAPDVKWDGTVYGGMLVSIDVAMTLKQAGPDLTVDSFVAAAESICEYEAQTGLVPGSRSAADHAAVQAEMMARATIDRSTDPPTFRWVPFGEITSFESVTDCVQPTPPPGYDEQPGPSYYEEWETP